MVFPSVLKGAAVAFARASKCVLCYKLVIHGARAHNLKISMEIPRDKLVVVTGQVLAKLLGLWYHLCRGAPSSVGKPASFGEKYGAAWCGLDWWFESCHSIDQKNVNSKAPVRLPVSNGTAELMTIFAFRMRVWVFLIVHGHGAIQSSSVEQIVDEV